MVFFYNRQASLERFLLEYWILLQCLGFWTLDLDWTDRVQRCDVRRCNVAFSASGRLDLAFAWVAVSAIKIRVNRPLLHLPVKKKANGQQKTDKNNDRQKDQSEKLTTPSCLSPPLGGGWITAQGWLTQITPSLKSFGFFAIEHPLMKPCNCFPQWRQRYSSVSSWFWAVHSSPSEHAPTRLCRMGMAKASIPTVSLSCPDSFRFRLQ